MQIVRNIRKRLKSVFQRDPDRFFNDSKGIIHVGANVGQERELYARYGLSVIWIEPIPEVYEVLKRNVSDYSKQEAYEYLITDKNQEEYTFNIANNFGLSSSILDLKDHKDIWPHVYYEKSITLKSITLKHFVEIETIDMDKYDTLVMDTQGSELLVLKGANSLLEQVRYIKTEVPNFEAYAGCCQVIDIENYLKDFGFKEYSKNMFAKRGKNEGYFDIVYKKMT